LNRLQPLLIAGGGIGGLAAAWRCAGAGLPVEVVERAPAFSEVGAGIQIGPNVTRLLTAWGLDKALNQVAAYPPKLLLRQADTGACTGQLQLGAQALARYGAPYATVHRADLHALFLNALQAQGQVQLRLNRKLSRYTEDADGLTVHCEDGHSQSACALVGADGLWSRVRALMLNDGPPHLTGHLAYRAMMVQADLPEALRSQNITVWMGPHLHVVQYPVRGGELLNLVVVVHGPAPQDMPTWDHAANAADLQQALGQVYSPLRALIDAVPAWRLWPLCDRSPLQGAHQQAHRRVALLGDAAHPMRPFLAQGAGMAIEDADALGRQLAQPGSDVAAKLSAYAQARWQRNARVQARAMRNGQIFHATGWVRWGRDLSTRLLGEGLLDMPWLYRGP
jgi:salicylate hydroxylase